MLKHLFIERNQNVFYENEVQSIKDKPSVKSTSSISNLDPFISDEGLLRVGRRLGRSIEEFNIKYPVIIPKISTLIIGQCHNDVHHAGRGMTMIEVRSNGF